MVSTTRSLLLVALLATTQAFAPTTHLSQQQQQQQQRQRQQQSARFDALEVVDDSAPEDPFAAYQPTAEQRAVVFKDSKIGSGYTVGDEPSQQLKIKYTATFLEPNPGAKFDFSENFICKTGENTILPGFEEGLKVRVCVCVCVFAILLYWQKNSLPAGKSKSAFIFVVIFVILLNLAISISGGVVEHDTFGLIEKREAGAAPTVSC